MGAKDLNASIMCMLPLIIFVWLTGGDGPLFILKQCSSGEVQIDPADKKITFWLHNAICYGLLHRRKKTFYGAGGDLITHLETTVLSRQKKLRSSNDAVNIKQLKMS